MFFFYLHMSRIAFVSKNIQPLSVSRSGQWIQLMYWQTARRLALLILDFGNKETKLGNHNASRFNLKITELKLIYLANALIFPPCPIIFSWGVQRVYTHLRLVGLTLHKASAVVIPGGFENRKPLSLWCKDTYLSILLLSVVLNK